MLHRQQIDIAFFGAVKLMIGIATPLQVRKKKRLVTQRALIRHGWIPERYGAGSLKKASARCKAGLANG
jgi:hypothetical protein